MLPVFVWEPRTHRDPLTGDGQWHVVIATERRWLEDEFVSMGYYKTICGQMIYADNPTSYFPIGDIHPKCQEEHRASTPSSDEGSAEPVH